MTCTRTGLQTDRFIQSFTPSVSGKAVYTTEDYVNKTVQNYLTTSSTVTIKTSNGASIISTVTGTTDTVVTVGICAGIGSLEDVDTSGVADGDYLQYNGSTSKWELSSGSCFQGLRIQGLRNFQPGTGIPENSVLFSSNGISYQFVEDKSIYIENLQAMYGKGITISKGSSFPYKANIQTDFYNFPPTNFCSGENFMTITDNIDQVTRKIQMKNINPAHFDSFDTNVKSVVFSSLSASNNSTGPSGLCYVTGSGRYNLNLSNYLTGTNGTLAIGRGGTSATGASQARANLGLSYISPTGTSRSLYPYNILGYSRPEFRDVMVGDRIRLAGSLHHDSDKYHIVSTGADYRAGDGYYSIKDTNTGQTFPVTLHTGPAGGIESVFITSPLDGFPHLYKTFTGTIDPLGGAPGAGACVKVKVRPSHINYGPSSGENGYGIKFQYKDVPQVKNNQDGQWKNISTVSGVSTLSDVTFPGGTISNKSILIYSSTGGNFQPHTLKGSIELITCTGHTSFTNGGISHTKINFGTTPYTLTKTNFEGLTGVTGNIQKQLEEKLVYTGPIKPNQSLLVLKTNTKTGTCSVVVNPTHPNGGTDSQVPMINGPNFDEIKFKNIYHGFTDQSSPGSCFPNLRPCLLNRGSTDLDRRAVSVSLSQFNGYISSHTGGLTKGSAGGRLQLNFPGLSTFTQVNGGASIKSRYGSFIAVGPSSSVGSNNAHSKITVQDLLRVPIFDNAGDTISHDYKPGTLAFFRNQQPGGTCYLAIKGVSSGKWLGVSNFTALY